MKQVFIQILILASMSVASSYTEELSFQSYEKILDTTAVKSKHILQGLSES